MACPLSRLTVPAGCPLVNLLSAVGLLFGNLRGPGSGQPLGVSSFFIQAGRLPYLHAAIGCRPFFKECNMQPFILLDRVIDNKSWIEDRPEMIVTDVFWKWVRVKCADPACCWHKWMRADALMSA